ncbi:tyrosine phosphatase family-domain-containing protein [Xylariaceae sp. FL0016]|nr:tyrosine phosphatase family-domain-containing protein [Xylariaceae sp. FL0016]
MEPVNFSTVVAGGLYRSGYPQAQDYPFIQSLKLKTIVTLVGKELPDGYAEFMTSNGITHQIFDMAGTKKEEIPWKLMQAIQLFVTNSQNWPLLIHCNHGKHRTGCVIGVMRKTSQWTMDRIIDEYTSFAAPKVRETDIKYLTEYQIPLPVSKPLPAALSFPMAIGKFLQYTVMAFLAICFFVYSLCKLRLSPTPPKQASSL